MMRGLKLSQTMTGFQRTSRPKGSVRVFGVSKKKGGYQVPRLQDTKGSEQKPHLPQLEIPGLSEFAAAVMNRRKYIPSPSNQDPLLRLFDEFDLDRDGQLTPAEVSKALQSRQIDITEEQATFFIDAIEDYHRSASSHRASRRKFPKLVLHMASTYVTPVIDPHQRFSIP